MSNEGCIAYNLNRVFLLLNMLQGKDDTKNIFILFSECCTTLNNRKTLDELKMLNIFSF